MSDHPPIHAALSAVMESVGAVAKRDRNTAQNFSFRGIDAVLNAVSPALRAHKVVVTPNLESITYDTATTKGGGVMTVCRVMVRYDFTGPAGDSISVLVPAEAFDSGDKATSKAMSVAFRTALLQSLALPTDEPDPDTHTYEREHVQVQRTPAPAKASPAQVKAWAADVVDAGTTLPRGATRDAALRAVYDEAVRSGGASESVDVPDEWAAASSEPTVTLATLIKIARSIPTATEGDSA